MLKFCKYTFSAIKKPRKVLSQARRAKFHIDEPQLSYKAETNSIVSDMFFPSPNKEQFMDEHFKKQNFQEPLHQYKTVQELFTLYEEQGKEFDINTYLAWFNQIFYCIKFQKSIQEKVRQKRQHLQGVYKAKYNENIQIVDQVFLNRTQILESDTLAVALKQYIEIAPITNILQTRKLLNNALQLPHYEFDYGFLNKLIQNIGTCHNIEELLAYLLFVGYLRKDIDHKNYSTEQMQAMAKAIIEKPDNRVQSIDILLNDYLVQITTLIIDKIHINKLNPKQLCDLIATYLYQQDLPVLPVFQSDVVQQIQAFIPKLTGDQSLLILNAYFNMKIGDVELFTNLLWNIVRQRSMITDIKKLMYILLRFKHQVVFIKNQQNDQKPIIISDIQIFNELFEVLTQQILSLSYQQHSMLLVIAYNNFIKPEVFSVLSAELLKHKEMSGNWEIGLKIQSLYFLTQLGCHGQQTLSLQLLKYQIDQLNKLEIKGYLEKQGEVLDVPQVGEPRANKEYIDFYSNHFKLTVKCIWTLIQQQDVVVSEDINYAILKLNELAKLTIQMKINKSVIRLISQINQYITVKGRKQFPQYINLEAIFNNDNIQIQQYIYFKPLKLDKQIYLKEKQYFVNMYKSIIQHDVIIDHVFYDMVLTNKANDKQALILLNDQNQYHSCGNKATNSKYIQLQSLKFEQDLFTLSKIPVICINLPDVANDLEITYQRILSDILPQVEVQSQLQSLKQKILELKKQFNDGLTITQSETQEEIISELASNEEVYELSDDDVIDINNKQ